MHKTEQDLITLAHYCKNNPTLLQNHLSGQVPQKLIQAINDCQLCLDNTNKNDDQAFHTQLVNEMTDFKAALDIYKHFIKLNALIKKCIKLTKMPDDPCPIPVGSLGTITKINHLSGLDYQIAVNWDNGRSLLLLPIDEFEVIE